MKVAKIIIIINVILNIANVSNDSLLVGDSTQAVSHSNHLFIHSLLSGC